MWLTRPLSTNFVFTSTLHNCNCRRSYRTGLFRTASMICHHLAAMGLALPTMRGPHPVLGDTMVSPFHTAKLDPGSSSTCIDVWVSLQICCRDSLNLA